MKIITSVYEQPGKDGMCVTHEIAITEDEILDLTMEQAKKDHGLSDADIFNCQVEHIVP